MNSEKFDTSKVLKFALWLVIMIAPLLMALYACGHEAFVIKFLKFMCVIVLIGPLLNLSGTYASITAYLRSRDEKKWAKINKLAAAKAKQAERVKGLKARRTRDENLPKNW